MTFAQLNATPSWYAVQSVSTARGALNANLSGPIESNFGLRPCWWVYDPTTTYPYARTFQRVETTGGQEITGFLFAHVDLPALIAAWKAANLTGGQIARITGIFVSGLFSTYSHTVINPSWVTPDVVIGQGSGPLVDYSTLTVYNSGVAVGSGPATLGPAPGSFDLTADVAIVGSQTAPQSGEDLVGLVPQAYLGTLPLSAADSAQLLLVTDRATLTGFPMMTDPADFFTEVWYLDHSLPSVIVQFDVISTVPPLFQAGRMGGMDSHAAYAVGRATRQSSLLQTGML